MRFAKMHGLGNDYVYVNCFEEKVGNPAGLAPIVSDRHRGIGADGLILIEPSSKADAKMRIFNADGSEAEMCGNGIRCVAKYVYDHKLARAGHAFAGPGGQPFPASLSTPKDIPVNLPGEKVVEQPIDILGQQLLMTCVSMGNPHAVLFCDDVGAVELEKLGPAIENHSLFLNRTNVHFVQTDSPTEFTMRTWERGSGITMACGTGACAACVAGVLSGRQERTCTGHLPGGDLDLNWCDQDDCVYMSGPAVEVFEGVWPD
ncbi:MAG: diaminopimelate epimerase [Sedimentisphaerales bacterium]